MTGQWGDEEQSEPDGMSLEAAVERHQTALLRYATRVLNNAEAAQDVVQEAFVRLHANREKLIERGVPFKAWLFRTTHNAAVDYIRKESRRRLFHQQHVAEEDIFSCGADDDGAFTEQHAQILQHLNVLKPKEREVLILRLQEGMSYREIAAVIQRSEGYVGTLIHSATKILSKRLRQAGVVS